MKQDDLTNSTALRSRLAPTPSGYLHLGNGVNFVITWVLVRKAGGILRLRIDDADAQRCRTEYIDDIFRQLDWLGLDWDEGPQSTDDFQRHYSQQYRFSRYRELLERFGKHAYRCDCSRKVIKAKTGSGVYPGFCRQKNIDEHGDAAVRLLVPNDTVIEVAPHEVPLAAMMGDFILWRRDNSPSYQLASLADDLDDAINLIVRGEDLLASSAAQLLMARYLGEDVFTHANFIHHPLQTCSAGNKLSKSDKALSLKAMQMRGIHPLTVYQAAAPFLGLKPQEISSLDDLLRITSPFA